jgi:hypothetical protein
MALCPLYELQAQWPAPPAPTLLLLLTKCIYPVRMNIGVFLHSFTRFGNVPASALRAGRSGDRISVGVRFFAPVQTGPGAHPASCTMGSGSFPGVKRPGRGVEHQPHLEPRLKSRAIPLLPFWAFMACYRVNFTFTFTFTGKH